MLLDVIKVIPKEGYVLFLEFENGEKKIFSFNELIDKPPFDKLKLSSRFFAAKVDYGTVTWPGEIDIAPDTLYTLGENAPNLKFN